MSVLQLGEGKEWKRDLADLIERVPARAIIKRLLCPKCRTGHLTKTGKIAHPKPPQPPGPPLYHHLCSAKTCAFEMGVSGAFFPSVEFEAMDGTKEEDTQEEAPIDRGADAEVLPRSGVGDREGGEVLQPPGLEAVSD